MKNKTIRPAQKADCAALTALALRSKAYWGYSAEFIAQCRAELTIDDRYIAEHAVFVLCRTDRRGESARIGFYALEELAPGRYELGHLFVEPNWIGRGLGRLLLDSARDQASRRGGTMLVIQSDPHAEPFYLAQGARRVGLSRSASVAGRVLPLLELEVTATEILED